MPKYNDSVELLEKKNLALSNQLDKITADLFKVQDKASELHNKLEEKKHSEQLAGWAVDRAIEIAKLMKTVDGTRPVLDMARQLCDGIKEIAGPLAPEEKETIQ